MFKSTVQRPRPDFTPRPGLGYFAFPPPNTPFSSPFEPEPQPVAEPSPVEHSADDEEELRRKEQEEQDRRRAEEKRIAFEESQKAEALRGEEHWVRCGGVLLDAYGRKDRARTNAIREELRLRDLETALREQWSRYEAGWKAFTARVRSGQTMAFSDVPWPVVKGEKEISTGDLTAERVEEFLLADLQIRGCPVTRKERIRSSLLRWHPDKLAGLGLFRSVAETDRETIAEGISAIARSLHQMNSTS